MAYKLHPRDPLPLVSTRCANPCEPDTTAYCNHGIFIKCDTCIVEREIDTCDCMCEAATPAHVAEARLRSKTIPREFKRYQWYEEDE